MPNDLWHFAKCYFVSINFLTYCERTKWNQFHQEFEPIVTRSFLDAKRWLSRQLWFRCTFTIIAFPSLLQCPTKVQWGAVITNSILYVCAWRTKQVEQTLRAKVKNLSKVEIQKNAFNEKWWAYRIYIRQKKCGVAVNIYYQFMMLQSLGLCM